MSQKTGRGGVYSAHELLLLEALKTDVSGRLTAEHILREMTEFTPDTLLLTAQALSRRGDISVYSRQHTYDMELRESSL
ncbi:hypothetical protein [Nitrospira sp. Nam74]